MTEEAVCTLCAKVESPGFYTGCMIEDGHECDGWRCDGKGNLSRNLAGTYPEIFPIGARVTIKAGPHEGSDRFFNGRGGVIERWHECSTAVVRLDKAVQGWANPAWITAHNLRVAPSPS